MNHTETLTRYVANFVDELVKSGLKDVVISPGSRSTPLAMLMTEHDDIKEWVIIDERSAAFFGLGIAKQTKRPVAILCTSGTAAANYFPAIVEAHYSRVPLVVLTADRPHELRDVGAPQAIEQNKLYGNYVKWFQDIALPEASSHMLQYVRSKAARALHVSQEGNAGPVHLNFPFREPLIPDLTLTDLWGVPFKNESYNQTFGGNKKLTEIQLNKILKKLTSKQRGVIVCGPQVDEALAMSIVKLASSWGVPILADPLSQLRAGQHPKEHVIEGYDAFLRNATIREQLKPDYIIRFGAMPISKNYLFYVKEHKEALQFVVEENVGFREPVGNSTAFIYADPSLLCNDLIDASENINGNTGWFEKWQQVNKVVKKHVLTGSEKVMTEGEVIRSLLEVIPGKSSLYVGNSMAVRDLDTFFVTTEQDISILANRGASGIDGMVSSGLGVAATSRKPVTLVLGDLSFYHDLNGLLTAKHYGLSITILLINNNGGGIFSFLPQAKDKKHFDALFGTPLHIDFKQVITMYGGEYNLAANEADLKELLTASYTYNGLSVIEIKTDRESNVNWHRKKWQLIEQELLKNDG